MFNSKYEKGQTIVLIAVMIIGLLALAALVVDGGNFYLIRRQAQTAADSAALAAAYEKCVHHVEDLTGVVNDYAVQQNRADSATWSYSDPDENYPKGKITVNTFIERSTFFAKVISKDTVAVSATAAVGCFLPADANQILPVAWTCRAHEGTVDSCFLYQIPVEVWDDIIDDFSTPTARNTFFETYTLDVGDDGASTSLEKKQSYMTNYLAGVDPASEGADYPIIYMVMDDSNFQAEIDCMELNKRDDLPPPSGDLGSPPGVGLINCDFNDDGFLDVEGGAERGWLQLGDVGASDLWSVMLNGYPGVLYLPQWFVGSTGVINSVFINAHTIKFRKNLIPVYNAICEDTTEENLEADCSEDFVTSPQRDIIQESSGSQTYHRVPGIATFVITCVSKGTSEPCPGKTLSGVKKNTSVIEGYFLSGYVAGTKISNTGFDLGVYVLSLIE